MRKSPRQRRGDTGHIAKPAPQDQGTADLAVFHIKDLQGKGKLQEKIIKSSVPQVSCFCAVDMRHSLHLKSGPMVLIVFWKLLPTFPSRKSVLAGHVQSNFCSNGELQMLPTAKRRKPTIPKTPRKCTMLKRSGRKSLKF